MPPKKRQKKQKDDKWQCSEAKSIMAQDMMDGILPCHQPVKDPERMHRELHADRPEFKDHQHSRLVPTRIKTLQVTVHKLGGSAQKDKDALPQDRARNPKSTHGHNGRVLWKDSDADARLKDDMAKGRHLAMTAEQLCDSSPAYAEFGQRRLTKRIDQLKQDAKPCGRTPGQNAASKLPRFNKEKSRKGVIGPHNNET